MRLELRHHSRASRVKKITRIGARTALAMFIILCICAVGAPALTINTQFVGGNPPANAVGGGNIEDIVNAAAHMWESVYSDSITITLYYGWAPDDNAGTHTLITQGGTPNRELCGRILFDNSGAVPFYLDPTPYSNDEYARFTEESQNLGGGYLNVARIYTNPIGAASGHVDLLSVVLHEIGHSLGLSATNASFIWQSRSGIIDIISNLSYKGTIVPLAYNYSGIVPHFDVTEVVYGSVMAGINGDERRIPSELDILANAQISEFIIRNLRPQQSDPADQAGMDGTRESLRVPGAGRVSADNGGMQIKSSQGLLRNIKRITAE
jgi:hypothetical protein